ncbi:MAG: DUF2344 domain-containing protein [Clostridia bacterium]|nr:DUF2344 domain-containing protein [Clostridia bacterium]
MRTDAFKVRITFRKSAAVRYVSHLDMMRAFKRALRRSGLPIVYTEGFNVHPVMIFTPPLSVGYMSECELLDIGLTVEVSLKEVLKRLAASLPDGFMALKAVVPERPISDIAFSTWKAESPALSGKGEEVKALLSAKTVPVAKNTKGGDTTVDAAPYLKDAVYEDGEVGRLTLTLPSGNDLTINPRLVASLITGDAAVDYTRVAVLDKNRRPL